MTGKVTFGMVHGEKIDAHYFCTAMNYMQSALYDDHRALADSLKEAAGHIDDPDIAGKYVELAEDEPWQNATVTIRSGPLLSAGRGQLCQSFLENSTTPWLFMSDTDMTWEPGMIRAFVQCAEANNIRALGGIVWMVWTGQDGKVARRQPNIFRAVDTPHGVMLGPIFEDQIPENAIMEVGACGAAILLLHRDLLLKIREEQCAGQPFWWHHLPTAAPVGNNPDQSLVFDQYGEDTSFCMRVRRAGEKLYVHTGAQFGHAKTVIQ